MAELLNKKIFLFLEVLVVLEIGGGGGTPSPVSSEFSRLDSCAILLQEQQTASFTQTVAWNQCLPDFHKLNPTDRYKNNFF